MESIKTIKRKRKLRRQQVRINGVQYMRNSMANLKSKSHRGRVAQTKQWALDNHLNMKIKR